MGAARLSHYDFRTLSPLDFEELVRDLLQAEFGLLFESFGPGKDLGIDFRFATGVGGAVVQAKHYAESGFDALLAATKREDAKVKRLNPPRYLLVTSVSLNPMKKAKLKAALASTPIPPNDIYGSEDINNLLGRHPGIEKKHFKLWLASAAVLDRIIHSGVYNRTQAEMDEIRAVVPKFVHNDSVPQAQAILEKAGVLIIAGQPGVGKSTLARMLIWLHAQQGWTISVIDDIADAFTIAHEGERRLVFFDDFLGQVRLTPDWIRTVDQRLPPFLRRVKSSKSLRFIMTTRDYVLHQAQIQSDRLSGYGFKPSEFMLNVGYYTRSVKARMLFNHIYFSDLAASERQALLDDDFFLDIIKHRNFNPRIISLLTSAEYISLVDAPVREAVNAVLENPQILWEKPYRSHISDDARSLMLALFFNNDSVPMSTLELALGRFSKSCGHPISQGDLPAKFRSALKELEGSVIAIENRMIRFSNPGVQDFLQRVVEEDRLLPSVINEIEALPELEKAWAVWSAQNSSATGMAAAWAGAIARLMGTDIGTPLERLTFVIDVYDYLQTEEIATLADRAIDDLALAGIDGDEAELAKFVIEQLTSTLLPMGTQGRGIDAVTAAAAAMLRNFGSALSLDTIKSVGSALIQFGSDESLSIETEKAALKEYINELDNALDDISSVDELDSFEIELKSFMSECGVVDATVAYSIEYRRDDLRERESRDSGDDSGWRPSASPGSMSDDDIRCLFGALLESKR